MRDSYWVPIVVSGLSFAGMLAIFPLDTVKDADQFAISIAVLQVFLALAAFGGFWVVRSAAINSARDEAAKCSPECTSQWMKENFKSYLKSELENKDNRHILREALVELGVYELLLQNAEVARQASEDRAVTAIEAIAESLKDGKTS